MLKTKVISTEKLITSFFSLNILPSLSMICSCVVEMLYESFKDSVVFSKYWRLHLQQECL